ncbi:plasmid partition protein ParG [Pseudomonas aeruginosa]|uniref:plasmid partition protein ParG n=1 Tax=Pseudomonas aeruginosa TaxID=287 RepID=UPI001069C1EE|nr:plasmid partition protein ParG [Pseudomonas aeruginosa]
MSKPTTTLSAGRPSARTNKAATLASLSDDAGGMKRVNFELSADRHAKLKIHAAKAGKSIKELLTDYVDSLPDL